MREIHRGEVEYAVVEGVNKIGHAMGLKTIAEFVERDTSLELLTEIGVDFAQGYGISEPKPFLRSRAA